MTDYMNAAQNNLVLKDSIPINAARECERLEAVLAFAVEVINDYEEMICGDRINTLESVTTLWKENSK